jgi:hypothetical protein
MLFKTLCIGSRADAAEASALRGAPLFYFWLSNVKAVEEELSNLTGLPGNRRKRCTQDDAGLLA